MSADPGRPSLGQGTRTAPVNEAGPVPGGISPGMPEVCRDQAAGTVHPPSTRFGEK